MESTIRNDGEIQAAEELAAPSDATGADGETPTVTTRFILQVRPRMLTTLRLIPAATLLLGVAALAPSALATGCAPATIAVSGGTVTNQTTLDLSADGGTASADARGGDDNTAVGGPGGVFGAGGDATAGNGGLAAADAGGGMIDLDDVNSGGNAGNTIAVSADFGACGNGGNLAVSGGFVANETTIAVTADGGTTDADARGGDGNVAVAGLGGFFGDGGDAAAGNGGVALAAARGGAITIGNVVSGNNRGNTILARSGNRWFGRGATMRINGGTVRNSTTIAITADGATAVSNADGGNGNIAVAGNGGLYGDGGAATAGNGGIAVADASGGAVTLGDVNSGDNAGNTIVVEGGYGGSVAVDGGTVSNETTIAISADGGTAAATADGGDGNIAVGGNGGYLGDGGDAAAGNGGIAVSDASGGTVTIGDINSGGNTGNTIVIGG
jgi:hypothetical protein